MNARGRTRALVGSWVICLAVVAGTAFVADRVLPAGTELELQALAEIARLDGAPVRIVVLGDSRTKNATRWDPTLEQELRAAGLDAVVANLSAGGARAPHFEPVFDEIVAAEPDLVVVEVDLFRNTEYRPDHRLVTRLRLGLGRLEDPANPFAVRCDSRTAADLDQVARFLRDVLVLLPSDVLDQVRDFFDQVAAAGGEILVVELPRSARLGSEIEAETDAYRSRVLAEFDGDHIALAPTVALDDSDYYCDDSHLTAEGQSRYLDTLVPHIVSLVSPGE